MVTAMARFRFRRLFRPFNRLAGDRSGVSAVEFALILPIMLTLYLGGNEIGTALTISRKVTHVTSSLSDLAAQSKTITNTDMTNILNAASAVVAPYKVANLKVTVSSVKVDANKVATVAWSDALNTTARSRGSSVTLPASLLVASSTVIWAEAQYSYTPAIGYMITGTMKLSDQLYMKPRIQDPLCRVGATTVC